MGLISRVSSRTYRNSPQKNQNSSIMFNSNTTADSVTYLTKKPQNKKQATSAGSVNAAMRAGTLQTEQKFGGGGNQQRAGDRNAAKLDDETENFTIKKVSKSMGGWIAKGRQAKDMKQKELAAKICEKPQVINEYESGKAQPNTQIINKIQKALGIYISGKKAGEPFEARVFKKKPEPRNRSL